MGEGFVNCGVRVHAASVSTGVGAGVSVDVRVSIRDSIAASVRISVKFKSWLRYPCWCQFQSPSLHHRTCQCQDSYKPQ